MNEIELKNYDLEMTLLGGQAFNFDYIEEENAYYGFIQSKVLVLKKTKKKNIYQWQTYPKKDDEGFIRNYLNVDINFKKILKVINKEKYTKQAIRKDPDIRILNQDFEQTLLSFLVSSNNNIVSIRKIVRDMCKRFGKKIKVNGREIYLFPTTKKIAEAKLEDLLKTKLGFRAKFIKGAAKHLLDTKLSRKIRKLDEGSARAELTSIKGVGEKIADCVMVFSLGYENVTPLDVWAKRVFVNYYGLDPKTKYSDMRSWADEYFSGYSAYAGQFLFEYIRTEK